MAKGKYQSLRKRHSTAGRLRNIQRHSIRKQFNTTRTMSHYYHLLEEQIQLLRNKGYDEKSLNSPDKEGHLFTDLRRNFSAAVHQAWQEGEPVSFTLRTTGFFNDDRDMMHVKLQYLFNPEKNSLELTELELSADKTNRTIKLPSGKDLPHSSAALEMLRQQIKIDRNRIRHIRPAYYPKTDRRIS